MGTNLTDFPTLKQESSVPPYQQIELLLLEAISSGQLKGGDRLPAERELALHFGVSRMTLRHALVRLENRGLVAKVIGRSGGTFVQGPKIACDLSRIAGFTEQLKNNGLRPGARVLAAVEQPADDELAKTLEIAPNTGCYRIDRLRLADEKPVAIEQSWFPAERFPGLIEHDLRGSLYLILEETYGERPTRALETLESVRLSRAQAELLGLRGAQPGLQIERIAYSLGGRVVEYARDIFRGDRTKVTLWSGLDSNL
ncbi:GntR family transcriptional regulator [Ferrimicrobium sp.]|uniref:GntR family transcriptional regulator n=1 Tax=Ferrimicrobium sp. TaxID=2926050 RepID=UPI0027E470CB|nr:GntR family transcriptional regulator [Ferrimicrobium sp.]